MDEEEIRTVEMDLLVEGMRRVHGHDFSEYAVASLRRRLAQWLGTSGYPTFGAAIPNVLRDPELCNSLVEGVTVNVSEMFRDPHFFKALREKVVPHLQTYPHARVWVAGCATGEEVYSLAILLREEGLGDKCRIYATDLNQDVLARAQQGIFQLQYMRQYTRNYQKAGGTGEFSDYYAARYDRAIMDPTLMRNVVFAAHNLVTDSDFSEMQLILCRNVLIYFKPSLKDRVLNLFDRCLTPGGYLCLGTKEVLEGRIIGEHYREALPHTRIYRKKYGDPQRI
ncbi:MAG: protein-glutamate O-methyltransferase CheR [Burkholderiaceae bacterium]|nr:protein-glutamate O-methyltransferase CheR [Burkholderiaceae bacterium]